MVRVVFAGDWHGNLLWATSRIQSIGSSGVKTILHVGDFGIWPGPPASATCKAWRTPANVTMSTS